MTNQTTANSINQNREYSLITNERAQSVLIKISTACFQKAATESDFIVMMNALEIAAEHISEYPALDTLLIRGISAALTNAGRLTRWNQ